MLLVLLDSSFHHLEAHLDLPKTYQKPRTGAGSWQYAVPNEPFTAEQGLLEAASTGAAEHRIDQPSTRTTSNCSKTRWSPKGTPWQAKTDAYPAHRPQEQNASWHRRRCGRAAARHIGRPSEWKITIRAIRAASPAASSLLKTLKPTCRP